MHPVLWRMPDAWGSLEIRSYDAAICAAAMIFLVGGWFGARRRGLGGARSFACLLAVALAAVGGARGAHEVLQRDGLAVEPSPFRSVFSGFALQGGILAGAVAGITACALARVDRWALADAAAPAVFLALLVARGGCFLNGCCFGEPTDMPWRATYPAGSPAHLHQAAHSPSLLFAEAVGVHPTQVYEMVVAAVAVAIAYGVNRAKPPSGCAFLAASVWFAACEWLIYPLRSDALSAGGLALAYRALPLGFAVVGGAALAWRTKRATTPRPAGAGAALS